MVSESREALSQERFVSCRSTDDVLTAQAYEQALKAAQIPVLVQEGRGGAVDLLTVPTADFWDIRVPEHQLTHAQEVLAQVQLPEPLTDAELESEAVGSKAP